jgi:hypothetical protein
MAIDASLVFYSGIDTSTIPITTGQKLQTILQNIDAAINAHNTAPDYTGYNLYCITQTDGTSHPTNTQNFAEGISKIVCDNETAYTVFTGTTYPAACAVYNAAISALQTPGLTYFNTAGGSTISISSGMTRNQVLTATYTAVGALQNLLGAPGTLWSSLSVATPTNLSNAFNSIITYLSALTTTVAGKQAQIATFDNSGNCLAGTDVDTIFDTVTLLIPFVCALPTYNASAITWLGVVAGVDMQTSVQTLVNTDSYLLTNAVISAGTGLTQAAVGSTYQGTKLSIDTTYTQLYKVMVDSVDTTPDYLLSKLSAGTGITLTQLAPGGDDTIQISNSLPATSKVKVNSSDPTEGYLANKLPSTADATWGLSLISAANSGNTQLNLTPTIGNPSLTWQAMMSYIASDTTLLTQFANLVSISSSAPGAGITNLTSAIATASSVTLSWTHQSGVSQNSKWRIRGNSLWNTTNFTPANPLSSTAITSTLSSFTANIPFQLQVDTIYSNGLIGSNIYEQVIYSCQTPSYTVVAGVISISQTALTHLDTIEYNLYNSGPTLVQTIVTTGISPAVVFNAVTADTYSVKFRYGTTINGTVLYSDDPSQLNAFCVQAGIVVP